MTRENFTNTLSATDLLAIREQISYMGDPSVESINASADAVLESILKDKSDLDSDPVGILLASMESVFSMSGVFWAKSLVYWLVKNLEELDVFMEEINQDEGRKLYGAFSPGMSFFKLQYPDGDKLLILEASKNPVHIIDFPDE